MTKWNRKLWEEMHGDQGMDGPPDPSPYGCDEYDADCPVVNCVGRKCPISESMAAIVAARLKAAEPKPMLAGTYTGDESETDHV